MMLTSRKKLLLVGSLCFSFTAYGQYPKNIYKAEKKKLLKKSLEEYKIQRKDLKRSYKSSNEFYNIFKELAEKKGLKIGPYNVSYKLIPIRKGTEFEMGTPGAKVKEVLKYDIEAMATEFTNGQLAVLMYGTRLWDQVCSDYNFCSIWHLLSDEVINKPAEYISWCHIHGYKKNELGREAVKGIANYLSDLDPDYNYRLPYEAEWEYMAQGTDLNNEWFGKNWRIGTREVGQEGTENSKGFYDMQGNMGEWVYDSYIDSYANRTEEEKLKGYVDREGAEFRVFQRAYWSYEEQFCQYPYRDNLWPYFKFTFTGFRLVREKSNL